MILVVPFEGKYVYVGGVWPLQRLDQHHKGLTLCSGEKCHKVLAHLSTNEFPRGKKRAFTRFFGHASITELEDPRAFTSQHQFINGVDDN
jgi:hypothetical protein